MIDGRKVCEELLRNVFDFKGNFLTLYSNLDQYSRNELPEVLDLLFNDVLEVLASIDKLNEFIVTEHFCYGTIDNYTLERFREYYDKYVELLDVLDSGTKTGKIKYSGLVHILTKDEEEIIFIYHSTLLFFYSSLKPIYEIIGELYGEG